MESEGLQVSGAEPGIRGPCEGLPFSVYPGGCAPPVLRYQSPFHSQRVAGRGGRILVGGMLELLGFGEERAPITSVK